jgi:hypothetical protein
MQRVVLVERMFTYRRQAIRRRIRARDRHIPPAHTRSLTFVKQLHETTIRFRGDVVKILTNTNESLFRIDERKQRRGYYRCNEPNQLKKRKEIELVCQNNQDTCCTCLSSI